MRPADAPLRIAMVAACPFPYPQGSQVLIGQLATALQRRGHKVRLVTYHAGLGQPPAGVEIHRSPALLGLESGRAGPSWQKPLLDLLLLRELVCTLRRCQVDLVHAHNFEGLGAALLARRLTGVRVVYHVHNAMGLELHTYFRSRLGQWAGKVLGRWVDAHLTPRADFCLVLSDRAKDYFRGRGVVRLQVVPPGVDFEPGEGLRARRELGDGPLVLYSGNLDRYQDLDLLMAAFRLVMDVRPEARLVFVTHAPPVAWRALAERLGIGAQTTFIRTDDFGAVRDLLAAADVAVCPRQVCFGFPIKLLNYMAAGQAIVVSAGSACGLRHLEEAWVVRNGDSAEMAGAILTLLDNRALAHRLGQAAQRTVRREYTWERAVDALEVVYEEVGRMDALASVRTLSRRRQS